MLVCMLFWNIGCAGAGNLTPHVQLSSYQHLADAHKLHWQVSTLASCIHPRVTTTCYCMPLLSQQSQTHQQSPAASLKQATLCMRTTISVVPMLSILAMVLLNNFMHAGPLLSINKMEVTGTFNYMSPELMEVVERQPKKRVTYNAVAADWWAVGASLYHMGTGFSMVDGGGSLRDVGGSIQASGSIQQGAGSIQQGAGSIQASGQMDHFGGLQTTFDCHARWKVRVFVCTVTPSGWSCFH